MMPLCIDLFCGLGGWAEGFLAEGYDVIGFDIERHRYPARDLGANGDGVKVSGVVTLNRGRSVGEGFNAVNEKRFRRAPLTGAWCEYPGQLVLQDVLTLHGSQFRDAAVIVASPPCQAYSYRAMPWKRAKALPPPSNELFDACFRIQREASEAGRYIPLVVENVCGAQKWVGRAAWHFGSFYLWGDVPALMPTTLARKVPVYSDPRRNGGRGVHLTSPRENVNGIHNGPARLGRDDGTKQGGEWWHDTNSITRKHSSRSSARKQASAEIAKIPFDLANHIARVYKP